MSLKIDNAYKIKSEDIENIIEDLYKVKEELFNLTVQYLKDENFKNEQEVNDFFSKVFTSDWSWLKCSVMFYFYQGKIIVQFFNSFLTDDLFKKIQDKYKMKPYHFQNNSDPEKIRNWKEREEFWKSLSNDFGTSFSDKGLQYNLISNSDIFDLKRKADILYFDKPENPIKSLLKNFFSNLFLLYGK